MSIDVNNDAKMNIDFMLTLVNLRQKETIDVNWRQFDHEVSSAICLFVFFQKFFVVKQKKLN